MREMNTVDKDRCTAQREEAKESAHGELYVRLHTEEGGKDLYQVARQRFELQRCSNWMCSTLE